MTLLKRRLLALALSLLMATVAARNAHGFELEELPHSMPTSEAVSSGDVIVGDRYTTVAPFLPVAPYPPVASYPPVAPYPPSASCAPVPSYVPPIGPQPMVTYRLPWVWQILPEGLIYRSYLAGVKEPRMASVWTDQKGQGWLWDFTVGGRVGLIRYGTLTGLRPEGWELDLEGAAFPELILNHDRDLRAVDFRGGVPLTYAIGNFQAKFGYYHTSSHIGDEYLIKNPTFPRLNFSRDVLIFGIGYFLTDNVRLYGETGWAFFNDGGSRPWEFQFGAEYSPIRNAGLFRGSPFAAINAHLRQEVAFGGSLVVETGWQWMSAATGRRLRVGFEYFNGKSEQYQFLQDSIQQFAFGTWYDY